MVTVEYFLALYPSYLVQSLERISVLTIASTTSLLVLYETILSRGANTSGLPSRENATAVVDSKWPFGLVAGF